jgi:methionyl-tRNA formyltransferase
MKIIFAGTPLFALPCLEALFTSRHQLLAVYTQPDRPAGRGRHVQASAIKQWASTQQLSIKQPLNFKDSAAVDELRALAPDLMIVIAYGLILPPSVLAIPRLGCINVHASLLPRWRGAAPIQQAILQGDEETGITIMQMDAGLDTGAILAQVSCPIAKANAEELHHRLSHLAVDALLTSIDALEDGRLQPQAQNDALACYAAKIHKTDAAINWNATADVIERQIRAFNPWPIAYTQADELCLRIHQARVFPLEHHAKPGTLLELSPDGMLVAAGKDALRIERLQVPGGKILSIAEWLRGRPKMTLTAFESPPFEKK